MIDNEEETTKLTPLDRMVGGLIAAPKAWRGIINDWHTLDDDLKEHYANDAEWLLTTNKRLIREAGKHPRIAEVMKALDELASIGDLIEKTFGFRPEIFFKKNDLKGVIGFTTNIIAEGIEAESRTNSAVEIRQAQEADDGLTNVCPWCYRPSDDLEMKNKKIDFWNQGTEIERLTKELEIANARPTTQEAVRLWKKLARARGVLYSVLCTYYEDNQLAELVDLEQDIRKILDETKSDPPTGVDDETLMKGE